MAYKENPTLNHFLSSSNVTLTNADSGAWITGNTNDIQITLPITSKEGWYMRAMVASNGKYVRVNAGTGNRIRVGGPITAVSGYVRANSRNAFIEIYSILDGLTTYYVPIYRNAWLVDA